MDTVSITRLGAVLLTILAVATLLAAVGPKSMQPGAFIVAVLLLLMLASSFSGGRGGRSTKSLAQRREEFGARKRDRPQENTDSEANAQLWQAERERRARRERPS